MTNRSPVEIVVLGHGDPARVVDAVGTVPLLFRLVTQPSVADWLAWVLADDDAWPAAVTSALEGGAAAVVVDSPRVLTPDAIASLSDSPRPVVLLTAQTHAPAVRAFGERLAAVRAEVAWVEALLVVRTSGAFDARAALWDALVTLAAAGIPVDELDHVTAGARSLVADGRSALSRVHVTVVQGSAAVTRTEIAAFGSFGSLTVTAGDPLVAAPGDVVQVGDAGALVVPTDYRTGRRLALCEIHDALTDGQPMVSPVSAYEREVALVEQAFGVTASDGSTLE